MFRTAIFIGIAALVYLSAITARPAFGESQTSPAVDKVVIINNQDAGQVSFEIKNAFTKEIEEGIKSGIPTTFTFFIELHRKRGLWFDETLANMTFRHTVRYDNLKQEYEILLEEQPQNIIRVKDIGQAKKIMASSNNIIVTPALKKEETYQLRIKAALDPVNLPFPLNYMLFFVSFWNYETDWHEKEFTP